MAVIALVETATQVSAGIGDVVTVSASVDSGARPTFYSPDNGRRLAAELDDLGVWTAAWATSKAGDFAIRIEAPSADPVVVVIDVTGDGPPAPDYYGTPLLDQAYGARDDAVAARNAARLARDSAQVARTGAENARTGAEVAASEAALVALGDADAVLAAAVTDRATLAGEALYETFSTATSLLTPRVPASEPPPSTRWLASSRMPDGFWQVSGAVDLDDPYGIRIGPHSSGNPQLVANNFPLGDLTDLLLVLEVRAMDLNNPGGFLVYLSDLYGQNVSVVGVDRNAYRPEAGVTYVTVAPKFAVVNTGAGVDLTNVERLIITFAAPSGTHTAYVQRVGVAPIDPTRRAGTWHLDFDDCSLGQMEHAIPALVDRQMPGTIAGINERVRLGTNGFTLTAVRALIEEDGWAYNPHCDLVADHVDWTTLTPTQQRDQVRRTRLGALALGLPADFGVYPFGTHDATTRAAMREVGFLGARTVGGFGSASNNPPIVDGNRFSTPAIAFSVSNMGLILDKIEDAADKSQVGCLLIHNVQAGASVGETLGTTDLTTILDALEAANLDVTTREKVAGLT